MEDIDDILAVKSKKKKINCGAKGKSGERNLCHILNQRFILLLNNNPSWGSFTRSIGSGNRWASGNLSQAANQTFSGDISTPTNFVFVLESKCGYNDVDLCAALEGGHTTIDAFLKQVSIDSERSNRKPMLLWKKDRKPLLAFIKTADMPPIGLEYYMKYRDWTAIVFDVLLTQPDSFFFQVAK